MKMKLLEPCYYDEFKCIGNECINHCCKEWKITIDDATYNFYQSLETPFGERLKQNIITDNSVHHFKLNMKNKCPFLNEECLCNIYIELGEENMCHTCKIYPRITKIHGDVIEQTLTMSCPEVARILIEQKEKIEFHFSDNVESNLKESPVNDILFNLLLKARACSINIIQSRNFSLLERQLLLLIFTNKIQECIDKNSYSDVDNIVSKFSDMNILSLYVVELGRLTIEDHLSSLFIDNFISHTIWPVVNSISYMKEIFERQILNVDQMTLQDFLLKYTQEFNSYMKDKFTMYENFYVHTLFRYYMDALDDKNVLKQVTVVNIGYLIIHTYQMISWIDSGKQLSTSNSQLIFGSFSSLLEHNSNRYNQIFEAFEKQNLTSLAFWVSLLS